MATNLEGGSEGLAHLQDLQPMARFTANRLVTSVISSALPVRVMIGTVAGVLPA